MQATLDHMQSISQTTTYYHSSSDERTTEQACNSVRYRSVSEGWYALSPTRSDPSLIRILATSLGSSTSIGWMTSGYLSTRPSFVLSSRLMHQEDPLCAPSRSIDARLVSLGYAWYSQDAHSLKCLYPRVLEMTSLETHLAPPTFLMT